MLPDATRSVRSGLLFAVLSAATFGASGPFAKALIATGWTAGGAVFVRIAGGAVIMLAVVLITQRSSSFGQLAGNGRTVILYGVLAVAGVQLCFFNAVQHLSVGVALLIEYLAPVIVIAWVWITTRRRPQTLTLIGAATALVGAAAVLDIFGTARIDLVGVLWGLSAAVGLACYFIIIERAHTDLGPVVLAASGMTIGAVTLGALGAVGVLPLTMSTAPVVISGHTMSFLVPVVGLIVVCTVIAYLAGIAAITRLGSTMGSLVALVEVLFAVLAAWLLLGESITAIQLIGGVVIIGGLILARMGQRVAVSPEVAMSSEQ